jgi:hypothetical protein
MNQNGDLKSMNDSMHIEDPTEKNPIESAMSAIVESPDSPGVIALEKRLLHKCDLVIIPLSAFAYFVNYLVSGGS